MFNILLYLLHPLSKTRQPKEVGEFYLCVLYVSLVVLFTTEAQKARSMFSSFSLCSLCLCGYIFSPRRHRAHEVCFLLSLCVLSVSVVISFHRGGTEGTKYVFFFLFVFSVSLWLYLFTTEAQSARSIF